MSAHFLAPRPTGSFSCNLGLLASLFLLVGHLPAADLARDGVNHTTLLVPEEVCPVTRLAVDDLVYYLEKITGTTPEVVHSPAEVRTPVTLWIGLQEGVEERFPEVDLDFQDWEEMVVVLQGNDLLLAGRDKVINGTVQQAGTSLAIYGFLERNLGVRWLWPGELGQEVPVQPNLTLEEFSWHHRPLIQRQLVRFNHHRRTMEQYQGDLEPEQVLEKVEQLDQEVHDWHRRQRAIFPGYRIPFTGQHAFNNWFDVYGEDHPEYFALQPDGSRTPFPSPERAKLCLANPDVATQWMEEWAERLENQPAWIMANIGPGDSAVSGICVCSDCEAWDVPGGPMVTLRWRGKTAEVPAVTDRYVKFWQRAAALLEERFPDREVYLGTMSYGPYRSPPVERRLPDNVTIAFVGSLSTSNEAGRKVDRENWDGWFQQAANMTWRPNLFHDQYGQPAIPILFSRRAGEDFPFMAERGLRGINVDSFMNHWATQGLQYYLLAQLAWDPYRDVDALLDDTMRNAFGEQAAPAMREYFAGFEEKYYQLLEKEGRFNRIAFLPELYSPEFLQRMEDLLETARAEATEERHRERIDFVNVGLQFTKAQTAAVAAVEDMRHGRGETGMADLVRVAVEATSKRDRILNETFGSHAMHPTRYHATVAHRNLDGQLGPVGDEFLALLDHEQDDRRSLLPTTWDFLLDPSDVGQEEKWFEPDPTLDWERIQVTAPWGEQITAVNPDDPESDVYHGVAWYRTRFDWETPLEPDQRLWLVFGAVDESCWVYLNGREVGGQLFDSGRDSMAWNKPRRFDVTDTVREGENHLVVRVQALRGQGGIVLPAHLELAGPNLVPNGDFTQGVQSWRTPFEAEPAAAAEITESWSYGKFVDEPALVVTIADGQGEAAVYGSLDQLVSQRLEGGQPYEVFVRYRQTVNEAAMAPTDRPFTFRFQARLDDGEREIQSAASPPSTVSDWQLLSMLVTPSLDCRAFRVTLHFREPGVYEIDEVTVRRLEP